MMTAKKLLLFNLLFICQIQGDNVNRTAYVSKNGDDSIPNCGGNMTRMCASIEHVLKSFVSHNLTHLTILLDGGRLTKMVYEVNTTIFVEPTKIRSLTLKPLPLSKYTPVITNSGRLTALFRSSSAPTISINNIDFEKLFLVQYTTSQNTTGTLRISKSSWSGLSSNRYDHFAFIDGGGGDLNDVQMHVELTDFTLDSIANVLPMISNNEHDYTKWRITLLRGQLNNVGLHATVKNSTINVTDTTIAGYTPNAQYSINLQGFNSIHMAQINFQHSTCGQYGTFNFKYVGELVITDTQFVGLPNNWQVIRASKIQSVRITNCTFENLGTNMNSLDFSYMDSFNFTENNVMLPTNDKDLRGNFLWLSHVKKISITKSNFENEQEGATTSGIVISHCTEVSMEYINITLQWNPLVISQTDNVKLFRCHFKHNKATKGAGISVSGNYRTTVTIAQCHFLHNEANLQSGAIDSDNANLIIQNSSFIYNNANTSGTFRFSGTNTTSINLTNIVISTPSKEIPQFAIVLENNGPKLKLKNVTVDVRASNGDIDIFTTSLDDSSSFQYNCPPNTNVKQKQKALFSCEHCDKNMYSRQSSSIVVNDSGTFIASIKCRICPFGGSCTGREEIASRSNFWGFMVDEKIKFVQCFQGYCCDESEGKHCTGINSCAQNREGLVCGKCVEGYHINFFDNNCMSIKKCAPRYWFWVSFAVATIVVFVVIAFYEVIFGILKRCCCCCCCCTTSTPEQQPDHGDDDDDEDDSNDSLHERLIQPDINPDVQVVDVDGCNDGCCITKRVYNCCSGRKTEEEENIPENPKVEKVPVISVIFGFIRILFNFYQMKVLITIDAPSSSKTMNFLKEILPSILNLKITFQNDFDTICPFLHLDSIMKLFIKNVLIILVLIGMAMLSIGLYNLYRYFRPIRTRGALANEEIVSFDIRCKAFLARITMIGYINIVTFLFLVGYGAVEIYVDNKPIYVLLVNGEIRWLHDTRSLAAFVLFLVWALPFIPVLYCVSRRLQDRKITINWFLLYLFVPPSYLIFVLFRLCKGKPLLGDKVEEPNIKPLLSVFEAPFRASSEENKKILLWDARIILRRLIIAAICLLVRDYFACYIVVITALAICCAHHARVVPYKGKLLNHVEIISFLCLIAIASINFLWAIFYVYRPALVDPVLTVVEIMKVIEVIITLFPFILLIGYLLCCLCKIQYCCLKKNR